MIADAENRALLARHFPFLADSQQEPVKRFLQSALLARLEAGSPICYQGGSCQQLALVLEGSARVYKLGENGREITLYRVGPGQSCILTASCILSDHPFPAIAESETPLTAALVPAMDVRQWLIQWPQWQSYVFGLVARRLGEIIDVVDEVAFRRMDQRIASYLLEQQAPTIRLTHQQIASDLGSSREVVSRILKDLESQGLIRIARGSLQILDSDGLRDKVEQH